MKSTEIVHEFPPDRGSAMLGENANHQLPQKVEVGLLLPVTFILNLQALTAATLRLQVEMPNNHLRIR
jgi:hypothetical protein